MELAQLILAQWGTVGFGTLILAQWGLAQIRWSFGSDGFSTGIGVWEYPVWR